MSPGWPWVTAALLGAFHGVNPAMGWLFAVALGLQERRRAAVLRALGPIALGHLASVAFVAAALAALGTALPLRAVRLVAGAGLLGFGVFRLARPYAHPRWVGMRVGWRDLALWSFLMASAHGAGLMLAPVLLGLPVHPHAGSAAAGAGVLVVHTAALFLVMAGLAVLVYDTLGLAFLRRAWINLDLLWSGALLVAGGGTLLLALGRG